MLKIIVGKENFSMSLDYIIMFDVISYHVMTYWPYRTVGTNTNAGMFAGGIYGDFIARLGKKELPRQTRKLSKDIGNYLLRQK